MTKHSDTVRCAFCHRITIRPYVGWRYCDDNCARKAAAPRQFSKKQVQPTHSGSQQGDQVSESKCR